MIFDPASQTAFFLAVATGNLMAIALLVGMIVSPFLIVYIVLLIVRFHVRRRTTFGGITLLVTVPRFRTKESQDSEATKEKVMEAIAAAEVFFSNIGGRKPQHGFHAWLFGRTDEMAFEIVCAQKQISFYVTVPRDSQTFVEQALVSVWSDANIEPVEDYNIFSQHGTVLGTGVRLKRPSEFPIKTYRKIEKDPLNALTNAIAKLSETEGAAFQFIVRPTHEHWRQKGVHIAHEMKNGKTLKEVLHPNHLGAFLTLAGLQAKKEEKQNALTPLEDQMVQGLEEKASRAGVEVCVRLVACGDTSAGAEIMLNNMLDAFSIFNIYEYGNSFEKALPHSRNAFVSAFVHRLFDEHTAAIFNAEEMASLWHLPLAWSETPNIRWLSAKRAPAPPNTPDSTNGDIQLGENIFRGVKVPVWMKKADRQRHMYIIGKSGSGKTELMKAMVQQDIENGHGVCVIDPHGDFADDALSFVPASRADDVIFFDPADYDRPMGLNMLEFDPQKPEQKTFVINEMLKIFDKLYDLKSTGGPMFELYMRNAMLLLMSDPASGSTLMEIPKVLNDEDYRNYKLSKCDSQDVKNFWQKEATKAGGEASLANMVPYITSKLTPFIYNDYMRPIIGQQKSCFDVREVMDGQKILLLKLSKGKIGDLNAYLIGMVLVGKILMAALARGDIKDKSQRKDFYLYIDEFQNFLTDSISAILSEARKYALDLIVAHQFIGQLEGKGGDNTIRDAIFGNVGSMFINRIGVEDAEFLAKEMAPVFTEFDLVNVES